MLSHWPHVATHVATQVAQLVARYVFQWNRSHWRHVATHVADARQFRSPEVAAARRLVAAHVASLKGLGNKLSDLLPSPFTLATCAATCVATCVATCRQCESTITERYRSVVDRYGTLPRCYETLQNRFGKY